MCVWSVSGSTEVLRLIILTENNTILFYTVRSVHFLSLSLPLKYFVWSVCLISMWCNERVCWLFLSVCRYNCKEMSGQCFQQKLSGNYKWSVLVFLQRLTCQLLASSAPALLSRHTGEVDDHYQQIIVSLLLMLWCSPPNQAGPHMLRSDCRELRWRTLFINVS